MGGEIKKGDNKGNNKIGKFNVSKQESPIRKKLKPIKGSSRKTNGLSGKKRRYYEWDYTHNDIEVYDSKGRHLGSMDPVTGEMYKPPVPGRRIDLNSK